MSKEPPFDPPDAKPSAKEVGDALGRQAAWESLEKIRRISVIVQDWLEMGDDLHAVDGIKNIISHVKFVASVMKDKDKS